MAKRQLESGERLLTTEEVAELFRVSPKTAARWALSGRVPSMLTPGGRRRFRESDIANLIVFEGEDDAI